MEARAKYLIFTITLTYIIIKGGWAKRRTNPCNGAAEGALFPNPKTCYGYIQCSHGYPWEQMCPTKRMFNPKHSVCDDPSNVKCPGNRCNSNNGGCANTCVYIDNKSYGCECQRGFKLDTDQMTCIRDSIDMDSYCDASQHGHTLPHPLNCKEFVKCVGSKSVTFKCNSGLVFDPAINQCTWNRPGLCKDADFQTWSSWSNCFKRPSDGRCMKKRTRECKRGKMCQGFDSEVKRCHEEKCKKGKGKEVPEECGIAPLRHDGMIAHIVSGRDAPLGGYPWQVAFYTLSARNEKDFLCGGTLIGKRTIISAAHCFSDPARKGKVHLYKVVLGEFDTTKAEDSEQTFSIKEIVVHKNYNKYTSTDDIALIKLSKDVKYTKFVTPACLPVMNEELKVKTSCRVTGWGKTSGTTNVTANKLQEMTIPVVSETVCRSANNHNMLRVTSSTVCAGHNDGLNFETTCQGDSGGPLSCMSEEGMWKVYGVVSWGNSQCEFDSYNVFTKVSKYVDWINKQTARL